MTPSGPSNAPWLAAWPPMLGPGPGTGADPTSSSHGPAIHAAGLAEKANGLLFAPPGPAPGAMRPHVVIGRERGLPSGAPTPE